ncbi:MAG: hypothetical protein DHS20C05_13680 [Hyphococcus sp.]|nr:MAG: hypothetical protein DHS20C05_13680 [Marinicaulis sp.]
MPDSPEADPPHAVAAIAAAPTVIIKKLRKTNSPIFASYETYKTLTPIAGDPSGDRREFQRCNCPQTLQFGHAAPIIAPI